MTVQQLKNRIQNRIRQYAYRNRTILSMPRNSRSAKLPQLVHLDDIYNKNDSAERTAARITEQEERIQKERVDKEDTTEGFTVNLIHLKQICTKTELELVMYRLMGYKPEELSRITGIKRSTLFDKFKTITAKLKEGVC